MRGLATVSSGLLLLSTTLAGCLGVADTDDAADPTVAVPVPLVPLEIGTAGCVEAGAVSVYDLDPAYPFVPEPWKATDMSDEVAPIVYSFGGPVEGPVTGIWHMVDVCDVYDAGTGEQTRLVWAWLGVLIEPPPWDDGTLQRHFLLADLSFSDPAVTDALHAAGFHHVASTLDGSIELAAGVLRERFSDDSHGTFQFVAPVKTYRALDLPPTRFWFPQSLDEEAHGGHRPGEEGQFRPMAIDLHQVVAEGAQHWVTNGGLLAFAHTNEEEVGPLAVPFVEHPGWAGAAVVFDGFDRHIMLGPRPDVVLNETWVH